jgi:tetratricopeptide (TPR) repeat protein
LEEKAKGNTSSAIKKQNDVAQNNQRDDHDKTALLSNLHSGDTADGHARPESDALSDDTNKIRLELEGPASPNLLNPSNHVSEDRLFEVQLVLAQKLRLEKNNVQAIKTMISLLESEAPDSIKKTTMLELAQIYQENNDLLRAQQIYAQFCQRYPQDPRIPVIFLKLGILYREMGSPSLAIGKFYSVMTTAINLRTDHFEEYRRLVLHAQTEIADTYYYQGKYSEASDLFKRLLKEETPLLNRPLVQFKLLRSLYNQRNFVELQAFGQDFLNRFPTSPEQPEVRFLLATALKQLGNNKESLEQVLLLLQSQSQMANVNPATWSYWQQRTGNEIANQLYQEADYHNALEIYQGLVKLDTSANWQIPVLYQIGLVYERLNQAPKAIEMYQQILKREKELRNPPPSNMKSIIDMAKWRTNYLGWSIKVEGSQQSMLSLPGAKNISTNIP